MPNVLRQLKQAVHRATAPGLTPELSERYRLAALPRYVETVTELPGFPFRIPDGPSFVASWAEIFEREIYNFKAGAGPVRILDCGANVGVSCLYFHRRFPGARITAFEPDPKIFTYLQTNLARAGCRNIELVAKAVWSSAATLPFRQEGADAGRVASESGQKVVEIPAVRLRDYLDEPVDFLKMDIEGAETEVIRDVAPCLRMVRNAFVEYHSFAGRPQTLGSLVQILVDAGFRVHVHPMHVSPHPFLEISNHLGMDMQLNLFARREPAVV
ncbi:MAG: FkbM family methyltransferase [Verrucomicrobiota bacterium]|jgi:FkbM family methyltransferase